MNIGLILGDYIITEKLGKINKKNRIIYYKAKCSICGEERVIFKNKKEYTIYRHNNKTCINFFRNEEIGKLYGDYKIISFFKIINNKKHYIAECSICKRRKVVNIDHFKNEKGIYHQDCSFLIKNIDKRFYSIWGDIVKRTTNKKRQEYKNYGGRGINCNEFRLFVDFYDLMYESYVLHVSKYGEKNTTIDRIDVNSNYTKENCKWSTIIEQARNKRNTIYFKATNKNNNHTTYNNSIREFSKNNKINECMLGSALKKGMEYKNFKLEIINKEEYEVNINGKN